jgi:hypothetical protein
VTVPLGAERQDRFETDNVSWGKYIDDRPPSV